MTHGSCGNGEAQRLTLSHRIANGQAKVEWPWGLSPAGMHVHILKMENEAPRCEA